MDWPWTGAVIWFKPPAARWAAPMSINRDGLLWYNCTTTVSMYALRVRALISVNTGPVGGEIPVPANGKAIVFQPLSRDRRCRQHPRITSAAHQRRHIAGAYWQHALACPTPSGPEADYWTRVLGSRS